MIGRRATTSYQSPVKVMFALPPKNRNGGQYNTRQIALVGLDHNFGHSAKDLY